MPPETSKAIGTDVATLFNRIEQQASEYEQAFNDLDTFLRQAQRTNRQMEEIFTKNTELYNKNMELFDKFNALDDYINLRIDNMTKEVKEYLELVIVADFNNKAASSLTEFQSQTANALGIMEGANGITQFIEDIKTFQENKNTKLNEINELITKLTAQTDNMEDAKKEYMKLVRYVNFKISEFETKMNDKLETEHKQYEDMLANTLTNVEKKIKEEIYNYLKNKS